jgi:hypothetical protein
MRFGGNIAVLTSDKFPGGTSTALATELPSLVKAGLHSVYSPPLRMFRGLPPNPHLANAAQQLDIEIVTDARVISARTVVLHNPLIFKFDEAVDFRIVCENFVCVMHENLTYPNGMDRFEYERILALLDDIVECRSFIIAPISGVSRAAIPDLPPQYEISDLDWNNIVDSEMLAPNPHPSDRRGRHSRPGMEKWPSIDDLRDCFGKGEAFILGADYIRNHDHGLPDATFYDYGELPVDSFLGKFDFFVYFHSSSWRESFGRVISEAICAGKVVLTHEYLRKTFGKACLYCSPADVDGLIENFTANPAAFRDQVELAQSAMASFSRDAFEEKWFPLIA